MKWGVRYVAFSSLEPMGLAIFFLNEHEKLLIVWQILVYNFLETGSNKNYQLLTLNMVKFV